MSPLTEELSPDIRTLVNDIVTFMNSERLDPFDNELRLYAQRQAEHVLMTFGDAMQIDNIICSVYGNTHWMQAYGNPAEGQVIEREDERYEAEDCALFTFKLK